MKFRNCTSAVALAILLSSCGGGGNSGGGNNVAVLPPSGGGTTPTPTPPPATCSLLSRQNWAKDQIDEWYLFPETIPNNLNPNSFSSVQAYIDALTATARSQGRDRFFTFITSIAQENGFLASGATAGFGIRLSYDEPAARLFVMEAFEGAPALAAGIDRGTEILAIGSSSGNLQTVASLFASGGSSAVSNALGPSTTGTSRSLRLRDAGGAETTVTVTKANFDIQPISPRYGVQILDNGGTKVGYINLRTFIDSAEQQLRDAFSQFQSEGVTELVIDLRYNGGGLVRTAELFADLLGGGQVASDVQGVTRFRPSKSANNVTRNFRQQSQTITPTKIAFVTTGNSASASELVINAMIPYIGNNLALVGSDTFGKPVGQVGLDQPACDDRIRVVAFATENSDGNADYFDGLAGSVANSCQAADDLSSALGDPTEASIARALGFLSGASCSAISSGQPEPIASRNTNQSFSSQSLRERQLLMPDQPTPAQREVPGSF